MVPKAAIKAGAELSPVPTPTPLPGPSTSALSKEGWMVVGGSKNSSETNEVFQMSRIGIHIGVDGAVQYTGLGGSSNYPEEGASLAATEGIGGHTRLPHLVDRGGVRLGRNTPVGFGGGITAFALRSLSNDDSLVIPTGGSTC